MLIPRPYQVDAIKGGVDFFNSSTEENDIEILPTGSGKSVIVANIAKECSGQTLVFQPSQEILKQNVQKFTDYGYTCGIYSHSGGGKRVEKVTFATIGSVISKKHLFKEVKHIIIDECHLVNPKEGMYNEFIKSIPEAKVLGLTATPYRLSTSRDFGSQLKFLTRTRPKVFDNVRYYVQNSTLFDAGHLAKLEYYKFNIIDRSMLQVNDKGSDFTNESVKWYYKRINMPAKIIEYSNRLLAKRRNLLVFCSLIEEANEAAKGIPGAVVLTGDTEKQTRATILSRFKSGAIRCVLNVGVLTTGFDYPELEAVLLAKSTMSLSLYYQIFGRGMRPHPDKESCWLVDLGGNIDMFGKIETMKIVKGPTGLFSITNNGRPLTNVPFRRD